MIDLKTPEALAGAVLPFSVYQARERVKPKGMPCGKPAVPPVIQQRSPDSSPRHMEKMYIISRLVCHIWRSKNPHPYPPLPGLRGGGVLPPSARRASPPISPCCHQGGGTFTPPYPLSRREGELRSCQGSLFSLLEGKGLLARAGSVTRLHAPGSRLFARHHACDRVS